MAAGTAVGAVAVLLASASPCPASCSAPAPIAPTLPQSVRGLRPSGARTSCWAADWVRANASDARRRCFRLGRVGTQPNPGSNTGGLALGGLLGSQLMGRPAMREMGDSACVKRRRNVQRHAPATPFTGGLMATGARPAQGAYQEKVQAARAAEAAALEAGTAPPRETQHPAISGRQHRMQYRRALEDAAAQDAHGTPGR